MAEALSNIFDNLPKVSAPKKVAAADELTRYLADPTESAPDALLWWHQKCAVYPQLLHMALNYLSIPGEFEFTKIFSIIMRLNVYFSNFC